MPTETMRVQKKQSELRHRLGQLRDLPEEKRAAGHDEERTRIRAEMRKLEEELQDALILEPEPETRRSSSENREIATLHQRSEFHRFIDEVREKRELDGAEAELRNALLGDDAKPGLVPVEMLLSAGERRAMAEGREVRAITPVAAGAVTEGSQQGVAARVFSRSIISRLGIPMPSVPLGTVGYPQMLTGTTISQQNAAGEQAAVAGSFGGAELAPIRATGAYEYNNIDTYRLRGLAEALRNDLRASLSDHFDSQVLGGDGTAPNVQGILTAVAATPTTDPANADDFAEYITRFLDQVDGLNAYDGADLRVILGTHAYDFGLSLFRGNTSPISAYEKLRELVGSVTVSSRMPAAASNISQNLIYRTSFPERSAVMPVWNALSVIEDPYTLGLKDQTRLIFAAYWNFRVLDASAFEVRKIRSA